MKKFKDAVLVYAKKGRCSDMPYCQISDSRCDCWRALREAIKVVNRAGLAAVPRKPTKEMREAIYNQGMTPTERAALVVEVGAVKP